MAKRTNLVPSYKPSPAAAADMAKNHIDLALLEFQSPTAALIAEPAPFVARITTYVVTALVLSCLAIMFLVKVDRIVTAKALVVSKQSEIVMQPFETSIVRRILVHDGEKVRKGQLLAELDPTLPGSDDKSTTAQAESLKAEVARLRAELENRPYVSDGSTYGEMQSLMYVQRQQQFTAHVDSLRDKVDSARSKVAQFEADEAALVPRLAGAQEIEGMRRELANHGNESKMNVLAAQDNRLQLSGQLADTRKQLEGAKHDLAAAMADLGDYVHQWQSDTSGQLSQQERALSDMAGQSDKAGLRYKLVELRAPQDATVLSVARVSVGAVLQTGDEFLRLIPSNAEMQVEGQVTGDEIGYMQVGDPATIKFDTLPYILYGSASGVVEAVSPSSFQNTDLNPTPAIPGQPQVNGTAPQNTPGGSPVVYRVRIAITQMNLTNPPKSFRVMPGMPVSAEIKVGRRTPLEYFFQRMLPALENGMREP